MTLPFERTNAVRRTEQFLMDLCDPKKTPKVPKEVRRQAGSLLKHYPSKFDMEVISNKEDGKKEIKYQVFGNNIFTSEKMKVIMVDPPSGWKYGFPKALPNPAPEDFYAWLVSEGYPQKEIDSMGDYFFCRQWEEEIEN